MEKSTGELLKILTSKRSYSEFFCEEASELCYTTVAEYLNALISQKKLKKSEIIARSNLDKNYAYQIFNGNKTNPSRDKVLMLAFGMRLNYDEARNLLKIAGLPELYSRSPRDSIIIFHLGKGKSLMETNEQLLEYGQDILE